MIFPRLVYKSATEYQIAETQQDIDTLCNDGWFASVPAAIEGKLIVAKETTLQPTIDDTDPPKREELEAKANELGLKFDGRTSDAKLGRMISEALES